jgi:hypothetical protein
MKAVCVGDGRRDTKHVTTGVRVVLLKINIFFISFFFFLILDIEILIINPYF